MEFEPGQLVWAQTKGWNWWPAELQEITSKKPFRACVKYLGTYEIGYVGLKNILPNTAENLEAFGGVRTGRMERKDIVPQFEAAVERARLGLQGYITTSMSEIVDSVEADDITLATEYHSDTSQVVTDNNNTNAQYSGTRAEPDGLTNENQDETFYEDVAMDETAIDGETELETENLHPLGQAAGDDREVENVTVFDDVSMDETWIEGKQLSETNNHGDKTLYEDISMEETFIEEEQQNKTGDQEQLGGSAGLVFAINGNCTLDGISMDETGVANGMNVEDDAAEIQECPMSSPTPMENLSCDPSISSINDDATVNTSFTFSEMTQSETEDDLIQKLLNETTQQEPPLYLMHENLVTPPHEFQDSVDDVLELFADSLGGPIEGVTTEVVEELEANANGEVSGASSSRPNPAERKQYKRILLPCSDSDDDGVTTDVEGIEANADGEVPGASSSSPNPAERKKYKRIPLPCSDSEDDANQNNVAKDVETNTAIPERACETNTNRTGNGYGSQQATTRVPPARKVEGKWICPGCDHVCNSRSTYHNHYLRKHEAGYVRPNWRKTKSQD